MELSEDDLIEPPESGIDQRMTNFGLSALAELVRRKGHEGRIDRFVMVDDEHDEKKIDTAVALGVLETEQDGAVLVDNQEENDTTWGDITTDDWEWDMEAINARLSD